MKLRKKGGKADAVATDTGAAVIADRRKRHENRNPIIGVAPIQFFHAHT
jgi:hypothetical protein